MKYSVVLASIIALANAASNAYPAGCAYDSCLWKDRIPAKWKPAASKYCKSLLEFAPRASTTTIGAKQSTTITQTVTPQSITVTATVTASATTTATNTITATVLSTDTQTLATSCSTTVTTAATTQIPYARFTPEGNMRREAAEFNGIEARRQPEGYGHSAPSYPDFMKAECRRAPSLAKVQAACKCFLSPPVVTVTRQPVTVTVTTTLSQQTQTLTQSVTITAAETTTQTVTTISTLTTVSDTCTSTATSFALAAPISNCGAPPGNYPSATTGQITCTQPANAPFGSVNAFHRIEADSTQGTVFEGCIYAGPRSITTPSGGTHQCGSSQGTSITSQTDAGAMLTGYTYDGSFSPSFNDYFITRIGATQQRDNSYWGVLNNGVFTTSGGCGAQVQPGDSSLWQWDAFNLQTLLTITPQYAVVAASSPVAIRVTARSPNGGNSFNFGGARLSGPGDLTSDSDGNIAFTAPSQPGCYQYKAEGNNAGRSNAFYLNVVGSFPATVN